MASGEANNPWLHIGAPSTGVRGVSGDVNTGTIDSSEIAKLGRANVFAKAQVVAPYQMTDLGAVINTDASLSNTFHLTLNVPAQLANPTNLANGGIYNWVVNQNFDFGNTTLTYGSMFKWPGGTAPTLSTAANAYDMISAIYYQPRNVLICTFLKGFA